MSRRIRVSRSYWMLHGVMDMKTVCEMEQVNRFRAFVIGNRVDAQ